MPNLKPIYDAALAADAEVQRIMAAIDTAFNLGTPEGLAQALELRPALDTAKANAVENNNLYVSMRDASLTSDNMAANFTAPPDPAAAAQNSGTKELSRSAFDALKPRVQMDFVQAGGMILENEVSNG